MNRIALVALLVAGCSHTFKNVRDCDEVTGEKRVECSACLAQNEAQGWLGLFEYRPDAKSGERCHRTK